MKLSVPFYSSKKDTDCGPLALKMVLEYFGETHEFEELAKLEKQLETGLVWSVGIARAAKKLGFSVKLISTSNFSHEEDIDYYKKYANDKGRLLLKEISKEIKELGVEVVEKDMTIEELLSKITKRSVPIVLINWYVISGKQGFSGHFVPITDYDEKYIYIHNPGLASPKAHMPIERNLFLKAWESKGTDKDTVIIQGKPKTL
jgi:hypothetical protein